MISSRSGPAGWTARALAAGVDSVAAIKIRLDAWANAITGMNTARDKTTGSLPTIEVLLSPFELEILYHNDDISARIVSALVDECFREPWQIVNKSNEDDRADEIHEQAAILESDLTALGARQKFKEAMNWGRLYGLGAVVLGVEEEPRWNPATQQMEAIPEWEELDWRRVRGLKFLTVLDKRDLIPWRWYSNWLAPKFGDVAVYNVQPVAVYLGTPYDLGATDGPRIIHESRLIRFGGELTSKRERLRNQGADFSVLQKVFRALQLTHTNWQSASALLADASQGVFKIHGLMDMIAQQPDIMQQRMKLVDLMRSTTRAIILDAGDDKGGGAEDFTRVPTPFAGIPEMLDQTWNRLASAARMPKTILMGASKTGLNTDDSDMRAWYDQAGATWRDGVLPNAERLICIAAAARGFDNGQDWTLAPPNFWQAKPSEQADIEFKTAQRDHIYVDDGVWLPEEVALNRMGANGAFSSRTTIDVDARKAILALKLDLEEENARHPLPPTPPPKPRSTPGGRTATQAAPERATPGTPDPKPPGVTEDSADRMDDDLPWADEGDVHFDADTDPGGDGWITINGTHVEVKGGKIASGPGHMVGKAPSEIPSVSTTGGASASSGPLAAHGGAEGVASKLAGAGLLLPTTPIRSEGNKIHIGTEGAHVIIHENGARTYVGVKPATQGKIENAIAGKASLGLQHISGAKPEAPAAKAAPTETPAGAKMSEERYQHLLNLHAGPAQHTPEAAAARASLPAHEKEQYTARRVTEQTQTKAAKEAKVGQKIARERERGRKALAELTKTIGEETIKSYGTGEDR